MRKSDQIIKLVLADDHALFREGFRVMINKQPGILLIGEAANGEELLEKINKLEPDVVITDIKMPKIDGLEVMNRMSKQFAHIPVIALSNYDDDTLLMDMLEAGAKGYILKSADSEEIVEAIRTVHIDKSYYCSYINEKVARLIANSSFNPYRKSKKVSFNERELSIIELICKGNTNKEIADILFLSKRTIETHRVNILEKMNVKNTAGVVVYAIKRGLYTP